MKNVLCKILTALCALLVALPVATVYAAVDFTKDGAADRASVYVAGTPDCFPVESYDADSGTYKGAAPAFLSLVSEQADLNFAYIRVGELDRRATLARNSQVDLLFATAEETELLSLGVDKVKLFSVMKNGKSTDVYCVFTSIAGEQERVAIRSAANALTKDDVSQLLTTDSSHTISRRKVRFFLLVLGGALICMSIVLIVILSLLSKRKRKKETLIDKTTDIGNKQYFTQTFGSMISDRTREVYYIVYFAFAIDWVNSNYGKDESDRILRYAAAAIKQRVKKNEFCARIGGGSFAAAIYATGDEQVESRVDEILRVLNAYGEKNMKSASKSLFHAGVCALGIDDRSPDRALNNADQAYHRAVEKKRDYYFVNHDVLNEYKTKSSIREQARDTLERHAFTPYVQFIVNAKTGAICGGELLSRWENKTYGLLSPGNYIPILQDMGLIVQHDLLMLEEACKLLEQWQAIGKKHSLSCNLTRITISDQFLVDKVVSIADRYSFSKESLILEVTEDSIEEDKENALHNMVALKEKGFRIALDDFSKGYSTVTNLYEYAVDLVKLDRQIVLDADRDPHAAMLIKEIVKMCHGLQIHVLAEGVETENQAQTVRSAGCDYIQGYLYARALPLRELPAFEKRYYASTITYTEEPDDVYVTIHTGGAAADAAAEETERVRDISAEQPNIAPPAASDGLSPAVPLASAPQMPVVTAPAEDIVRQKEEETRQEQTVVPAETAAAAQPADNPNDKNMLHIQLGPYRLDLPGNVKIEPVSEILRTIQKQMNNTPNA